MVSWEDVINSLGEPDPQTTDFADTIQKYQDLIGLIQALPDGNETAAEMTALTYPACSLFHELVAAVDAGATSFPDGSEAEFYAAMSFVTWYLHKSWKSIRDPLTLPYAKVFAYIFLVGYRLGRFKEDSHAREDDPAA